MYVTLYRAYTDSYWLECTSLTTSNLFQFIHFHQSNSGSWANFVQDFANHTRFLTSFELNYCVINGGNNSSKAADRIHNLWAFVEHQPEEYDACTSDQGKPAILWLWLGTIDGRFRIRCTIQNGGPFRVGGKGVRRRTATTVPQLM